MIHKMRLKSEEFYNIKYNNKIIEVRLNDEKRKRIKVGDKIVFYKLPELSESILVTVEEIHTFLTFKQLYQMYPLHCFGYINQNIDEVLNKIYTIYSPEQERKNGVIAIKFAL